MKFPKIEGRTLAIGILVLLAVFLVGSQALAGCSSILGTTPTEVPDIPDAEIQVGEMVSASGIDRDGCPTDEVTTFAPSDAVYIVATNSNIPAGTDVFARLFRDDQPVEDSVVVTADQDYVNTCIYFEFEATSGAEVLDSGDYEAQLIVNGNPGPSVNFVVR